MKYLLVFILITLSHPSFSVWLNTTGKVTNIITYAGRETILVQLDTNGTKVAECSNSATFADSAAISSEARSRMYAMLLASQTAGKK